MSPTSSHANNSSFQMSYKGCISIFTIFFYEMYEDKNGDEISKTYLDREMPPGLPT